MKNILAPVLFLLLISFSTMAQPPQEDPEVQLDPKAQQKINNLRIAYLTDKLDLTTEQAEKFWPIYREFAEERRKIGQELRIAQNEANTNKDDPKKQQAFLEVSLKAKQRMLDLEKDYSNRMLKVITAEQVINLRKADRDFQELLQQRRQNQQRRENFREKNQRLQQRN